ncbi:collagen-binding domain-containing protein [Nocardioides sp.]|uniref:collagen-binding domain-containing protein n=1 Tax=Nocardioides sp. TaxID=35761 RepID=UPI00263132C4|nr:collagen-binding domain-containing protein [Nocardioides sp.]
MTSASRSTRSPLVWTGAGAVAAITTALALMPGAAGAASGSGLDPMAVNGDFTVMTTGDAYLANAEIEGSVAVGGNFTAKGGYPIIHSSGLTPTGYDLPVIDSDPTRLLIGGTFVPGSNGQNDVSSRGWVTTDQKGYIKIAKLTGLTVSDRGTGTWIAAGPSGTQQGLYDENHALPAAPAAPESDVLSPTGFTTYVSQRSVTAAAATSCLGSVSATESSTVHVVTVSATPSGSAADLDIDIESGKTNILELPATSPYFSSNYAINLVGGTLSSTTALIIRPTGITNGTTIDMPEFKAVANTNAATPNTIAPYTLIDLSGLTTGTDVSVTGKKISGSIFAPDVDLTLTQGSPAEGTIYAGSLIANGNGEIHHYGFKSVINCATTVTTTSAAPTGTTTTAAPTATTTTSTASVSASTSASTSATASATTSSSAGVGNAGDERDDDGATGALAETGSSVSVRILGIAVALLAAGAALVLAARRRTN